MDSVKDLVKHLKECANGSSMSELINKFKDKSVIKTFIKIALDDDKIYLEGKRYYAKGSVVQTSVPKNSIPAYAVTYETLEDCLNSSTPVIGERIFRKSLQSNTNKEVMKFLGKGITTEEYVVKYDKTLNKNIVIEKKTKFKSNTISVRRDGSLYVIMIIDHCNPEKSSTESYKSYEDFRSSLLAFLGV